MRGRVLGDEKAATGWGQIIYVMIQTVRPVAFDES